MAKLWQVTLVGSISLHGPASAIMESFYHIFVSAAILIFILTLVCAFIFWLIKCWRSKSSYELAAAVIQNKQLPQPEFYV